MHLWDFAIQTLQNYLNSNKKIIIFIIKKEGTFKRFLLVNLL